MLNFDLRRVSAGDVRPLFAAILAPHSPGGDLACFKDQKARIHGLLDRHG